jgi:hypothetical protein
MQHNGIIGFIGMLSITMPIGTTTNEEEDNCQTPSALRWVFTSPVITVN